MKKGIVIAVFSALLGMTVHAQTTNGENPPPPPPKDQPKLTPEEASKRQAERAQKELGLTDAQKTQFESFTLTRITNMKPIREKARATEDKAERKKLHEQAKVYGRTFDESVKSILTAEQLPKWEEHKKKARERQKQMREKRRENRQGGNGTKVQEGEMDEYLFD